MDAEIKLKASKFDSFVLLTFLWWSVVYTFTVKEISGMLRFIPGRKAESGCLSQMQFPRLSGF